MSTVTFSVAKLVQAVFCKYLSPYSSNFFKNFLPSANMVAFLLKTMPKSCQILTTKIVQFFDIKVATFKKNVKLIGFLADRSVQQMKFPIRFIIGTILSKGTKKKKAGTIFFR